MFALAELVRTAGNVLLTPIDLAQAPGAEGWRRALVAGAKERASVARAAAAIQGVAPQAEIEVVSAAGRTRKLWSIRRQGYDVACLMLTGEGGWGEKLVAFLSGAGTLLAFGASGQWYQVRRLQCRPASPRWLARAVLAAVLSVLYLEVVNALLFADAIWRLLPIPRPVRDPGPPRGKRVSFVVPTYNQRGLMDSCLPPLLTEAKDEHEVLVVDDASTDATAEHVRQTYPQVRVLRLETNRGFAAAVRAGIEATATPLFALINSDVQVRPGFLEALLPHFDHPDTFAVCSRIELPDGSEMETGNVAPAFSGILEPYYVAPTRSGPILYASGSCSIFHRLRYDSLGGLESFYRPFYWEDTDLGYRAWRRGWRSVFEPAASVLHQRRAAISTHFGDAYANEMFLRNALLFVWKNVRERDLIARHLVYVWARLAQEILAGEGTICWALLRALPLLPCAMVKRSRARRRGDLGDRDILVMADPTAAAEPEEVGKG